MGNLHGCGLDGPVGACTRAPVALLSRFPSRVSTRPANIVVVPKSGDRREAHLSTEQSPPGQEARLSRADEHPRRPCGAEVPPRQGPRSPVGLIQRVRERDAFVRLRRDGVRVRAESLWCSFVPDPELSPPQVAFAIGRAVGTAVRRNRLRRRLRVLLDEAALPPGLYLIGARPPAGELAFDAVRSEVVTLARRVAERSPRPGPEPATP